MPLPNPEYLTQEEFNWDDTQFPAVLLATDAAKTGVKRTIRWEACDSYDRRTVHDLIMGYSARLAAPPAEADAVTGFLIGAAYHTVDYNGGIVGGDATGLTAGVDYTFSVVLNTIETFYTVNGTDGQTFAALVAAIELALPASMLAEIFEGNIEVSTISTGAGEVIEVFDGTLFQSTTGFKGLKEIRAGVTTIEDVFDLNFKNGYQSYTELLIGRLRTISNQTFRSSKNVNDIYYNHGTKVWNYIHTDLAV